jgi:hypothetical protein
MSDTELLFELMDVDTRNRYLRELLGKHDCEVTFTKVDGTLRTMPCTLRTEAMPQRVVTEEYQTTRPYKPETLSVWCLDKSEWRAFKVANVREVRVIDGIKKP